MDSWKLCRVGEIHARLAATPLTWSARAHRTTGINGCGFSVSANLAENWAAMVLSLHPEFVWSVFVELEIWTTQFGSTSLLTAVPEPSIAYFSIVARLRVVATRDCVTATTQEFLNSVI
jgi:hypothetical protein